MSKGIALITNLQRETLSGQLIWQPELPPEVVTRMKDEHVQISYKAHYKGADFYLYQEKYTNYFGELDMWGFSERVILNIVENNLIVWENYQDQGLLCDLLKIVMNSNYNIDKFL